MLTGAIKHDAWREERFARAPGLLDDPHDLPRMFTSRPQRPAAPLPGRRRRSKFRSRYWTTSWSVRPLLLAVSCGVFLFAGLTHFGKDMRSARPFVLQLDDLAYNAGFSISQIALTGHRMTPDGDIFDALKLDTRRSMASFSIAEARARLQALPWVERATIDRDIPFGLRVSIVEREAYAVWRRGDRHHLIDRMGRPLAAIKPQAARHLPLISGAGAGPLAKSLLDQLSVRPRLASRLLEAERVGERRWTLAFAGQDGRPVKVHLPALGADKALTTLVRLTNSHGLLDRAVSEIDLRQPRQLTVRPALGPVRKGISSAAAAHPRRT